MHKNFFMNRIEKLLVVDRNFKCVGLITVKDIEKAAKFLLQKIKWGDCRWAAAMLEKKKE